jgi:hypothetical protein
MHTSLISLTESYHHYPNIGSVLRRPCVSSEMIVMTGWEVLKTDCPMFCKYIIEIMCWECLDGLYIRRRDQVINLSICVIASLIDQKDLFYAMP